MASLREVREVHYQMGTFLEIKLWHSENGTARRLIREAVGEVHRLEEILSNFDPESDLSHFNELAGTGKSYLQPDLYRLLKTALEFSARTDGYFDITVGPLVELWKKSLAAGILPRPDVLARTFRTVGYNKLKLSDNGQAELPAGMQVDVNGIAKGYAVDRVADLFRAAGVSAALINFGGSSIYALGGPPEKAGWEIGIQGTDGRLRGVIVINGMALSTSGSMGHFWFHGGKKYGHVIDPKKGFPVTESRMATVITPSATEAEALTKPLVILGNRSLTMIQKLPQAEAIVIPEQGRPFFSKDFRSKARWRELPAT